MNKDLSLINRKILEAGKKNADDLLYAYLDHEDKIIDLLKRLDGVKSEVYLKEVDKSLDEMLKFSAVFSDLTLLNTTTSAVNDSHVTYFEPQSAYWRDRQLSIPAGYVQEMGTDPKRFFPCYINRDNQDLKKIYSKYESLIVDDRLMVRPLRSICVVFPEEQTNVLYYVDPNTPNDHWYINDIKTKGHIIIENGVSQANVQKLFELTLPYFEDIKIDSLAKILNEESDLLSTFRFQLKKLINEAGDNLKKVEELKQDVMQPAIDTLNRKFRRIVNTHKFSIGGTVGTFVITLVAATVNGNLLQVLGGALPIGAMIGGMLYSENNYQEKIDNLRDNPFYLLWRIKKTS